MPRKKSLSTALISLMSVLVISLVVWLVLVFLSVTTGIEKNWLQKLTSLHAPLRITPTNLYHSSYFYQIDSLAAASNYTLKTIGEKGNSPLSDPYAVDADAEIPIFWSKPDRLSDGTLRDPVKMAIKELAALQKENSRLAFQDYEIGGALLRLNLHRPADLGAASSLSQMSYLLSLTEENPRFHSLVSEPVLADLTRLLTQDPLSLEHMKIEEVRTLPSYPLPPSFLPLNVPLQISIQDGRAILLDQKQKEAPSVLWDGKELYFQGTKKLPLFIQPTLFSAEITSDLQIRLTGSIQGHPVTGIVPFRHLEITKGAARTEFDQVPSHQPAWAYFVGGKCHLPEGEETSVLLPKNYRDSGAVLGDRGTLSYIAPGAASAQEQRILVRTAGFYDPGILSIGNKCLIVPSSVTRSIHTSTQTFSPDGTPTNGFFVWTDDLSAAHQLKNQIAERFEHAGIAPYWNIATYEEFEFSKDLLLQFQSDRTLFLLIAAIILIVACSNIISLLVLLVNDKKKEIAILLSMGASFKSIAAIFGLCGIAMGLISCLLGSTLAIFTLHHLNHLVAFLSALQGRAAFNPAFFGQTLPNQFSYEALLFVLIATPILSLAAGLIPAIKASRIRPSSVLRSE